jgi:hypothetical protein
MWRVLLEARVRKASPYAHRSGVIAPGRIGFRVGDRSRPRQDGHRDTQATHSDLKSRRVPREDKVVISDFIVAGEAAPVPPGRPLVAIFRLTQREARNKLL